MPALVRRSLPGPAGDVLAGSRIGLRPVVAHAVVDAKRRLMEAVRSGAADRDRLDRLVAELLKAAPQPAEGRRLDRLIGGWRQLWSDDARLPSPSGVGHAYQIVDEGFCYDIARFEEGDTAYTVYRRSSYRAETDHLVVRFSHYFREAGRLDEGAGLRQLAHQLESRRSTTGLGLVCADDLGAEGRLRNVYVDDSLRIAYGVMNGPPAALYVMERAERIGGAG